MAVADKTLASRGFVGGLNDLFRAFAKGFNVYLERRSRIDEINRLQAKSDAELEQMGLTRDDIARHVFRDLISI